MTTSTREGSGASWAAMRAREASRTGITLHNALQTDLLTALDQHKRGTGQIEPRLGQHYGALEHNKGRIGMGLAPLFKVLTHKGIYYGLKSLAGNVIGKDNGCEQLAVQFSIDIAQGKAKRIFERGHQRRDRIVKGFGPGIGIVHGNTSLTQQGSNHRFPAAYASCEYYGTRHQSVTSRHSKTSGSTL